jgi:hypothetical protein
MTIPRTEGTPSSAIDARNLDTGRACRKYSNNIRIPRSTQDNRNRHNTRGSTNSAAIDTTDSECDRSQTLRSPDPPRRQSILLTPLLF